MTLVSLLEPTQLRALAGLGYERGVRYWEQGRVRSRTAMERGVRGVVVGSSTYTVQLSVDRHGLVAQCSCPVGDTGMMCKHAVALALDYMESTRASVAEPASEPVFQTRSELDRWIAEHDVAHELERSAAVLIPALEQTCPYENARPLARLTLRQVASLEATRWFVTGRALHRPAAVAARKWLEQAAEDVRIGIAEEHQLAAGPRDEPHAGLWTSLLALRAELRKHAPPRSRATRATGRLEADPEGGGVLWHERIARSNGRVAASHAAIETRLVLTPSPQATCTCSAGPCTHAIALVDAVLDLLLDPTREHHTAIVEELVRPPWQRALAALDLATPISADPSAIEVWWQIETETDPPELMAVVKKPLKKGGFGAGSRLSPERLLDDYQDVLGEVDVRIAEQLAIWLPSSSSTYPWRAFAALVGHPRVVLVGSDRPIEVRRAALGFTALPVGDQVRLEPCVAGARFSPRLLDPLLELHPTAEPLFVLEPERDRCVLIDAGRDARHMWSVLQKHGDAFPPESHQQLLDRLSVLEPRLPISLPDSLKGSQLAAQPVTVVRLRLVADGSVELDVFIRPAPGTPLYAPGAGPRDVLIVRDGKRGYVRRDTAGEHVFVRDALEALPLRNADEGPPLCFKISELDDALELVAAVQRTPPGLEVEWVDVKPVIVSATGSGDLRVRIQARRDWFGIDGELLVDHAKLELAVLLDAMRRQQRFVRLDANRWVELSSVLREHLTAIADHTYRAKQHTELSPGGVSAIDALVAAGGQVELAPAWKLLTERVAASLTLQPKPPAKLAAKLRPYQVEGHAWLSRLSAWGAGGCLADDMGLGKTIQTIAVLLDRSADGPAMVLAPTSVVLNWADELRRFAPSLRPVIYGERGNRTECLATLTDKDVLIVSYGLLTRDHAQLASRRFATLVIDEAHALKNPAARRTKAARTLVADFRIALTGTPLENHLGELWSLFTVVFPNLLGSWDQFRERFALPIERHDDAAAREALSRVIRPFLLRRTKREVASELPARTEIDVPVALSDEERELYEDARLAAVAHLTHGKTTTRDERRRFQVLAALTRLRLLASHPRLYDSTSSIASSKMQRLLELLDELRVEGHRALVFSQFTSHLELVREQLEKLGVHALYLDGSTPLRTRAELIDRFQNGEADVFLISLKAGGTGINLTAADYVIHLDPWWNPAVEDQATDRAHRIGQTRPVTVYRLISRGTVEERILAMHRDKRTLVANVLDGTDVAGKLTTRDLLALLGGAADEPV
ncbi:MAG: SNF2-related protein [Kofleriaceae bacterium]